MAFLYDQWQSAEGRLASLATREPLAVAALVTSTPIPSPTAPAVETIPQTSIIIPTIGIAAPVIQAYLNGSSWDVTHLGASVGHLQGTAEFGMSGNMALAGHVEQSDGRRGVFAGLEKVNPGDPVILARDGVQMRYTVTDVLYVEPDDLSVLYPTDTDRLTLITCSNYNFFQDTYLERIVVVAERIS